VTSSPLQQIAQTLTVAQTVLVTCHRKPDGDAMGSMLGVGVILRHLGKDYTLYSQDGVPKQFADLVLADEVVDHLSEDVRFDATVAVDTGDRGLLGDDVPSNHRSGTMIVLDHHSSSTPFGDLRWHDATAAATGVLVAELAQHMEVQLDRDLSELLWCALYTDTGGFRYSSTDARVLRLAARLVEAGISPWDVTVKLYENNPVERMRLLGQVLATLELSASGQIASLAITERMVDETGADVSMMDGFINYARSIEGVEVAVQVLQQGQVCRISMRSKGRIDVGSLAHNLGGGGHHNAAGCTVTGPPAQVQQRILGLLEDALRDWEAGQ
jgi:bifunctional oligoribonuclease and PAP phosphatase NrnA